MKVKLLEIYSSVSVMNKLLDAELPASVAFQLNIQIFNIESVNIF
jgi:hypothetical protein